MLAEDRRAELEERARAREELEWRRTRLDLGAFIERANPGYVRPYWLQPLLEVFDRIERGERLYVTVEAPPRHTKTETMLAGGVRMLRHRPKSRVLYTAHTAEFANEKSRFARDMALRSGLWVGTVNEAQQYEPARTVRFWQTADGGAFMALGRGGKPIGRGFDLELIDDPFGAVQDAESPLVQERVWEWFKGSLFSRVEAGGSIVVGHQRWNDGDLIGRIYEDSELASLPWVRISLPAVADNGHALWPERWPLEELDLKRRGVGQHLWLANYQQRPKAKGARLFRDPERWGHAPYNAKGARLVMAVDAAASKRTTANRWAVGLGAFRGFGESLQLDVVRVWAFRAEVPEATAFVAILQRLFGCPLSAEGGGTQKAVPQTLRRISPELRVDEARPTVEKFLKWQPTAAAWGRGAIRAPASLAPGDDELDARVRMAVAKSGKPELVELLEQCPENWLTDYLGEMGKVTGVRPNEADDTTDMTSILWDWGEAAFRSRGGGAGQSTTGLDGGGF